MRRTIWLALVAGLLTGRAAHGQAKDKDKGPDLDRRHRMHPDLVLETGGRTGTCDVLRFTDDGKFLLACGDDKVVRVWRHDAGKLTEPKPPYSPVLRWSAWREQRGAIYALDLHPNKEKEHIAIAGFGMRTDPMAVVLERATGNFVRGFDRKREGEFPFSLIRAIRFSPSGDRLAYGTTDGGVWLWDIEAKRQPREIGRHVAPPKEGTSGKLVVRFLHFEKETTLLSVAENGEVREWNLTGGSPVKHPNFTVNRVGYVTRSKDGRLAASDSLLGQVEIRKPDGSEWQLITLRPEERRTCLAFHPKKPWLAIGAGGVPVGGVLEGDYRVLVYDLDKLKKLDKLDKKEVAPEITLPHTYHADVLTFEPNDGRYLTVAGGDNHEVTVWDLDDPAKPTHTDPAAGVGRGVWEVALSMGNQHLLFKNQRAAANREPGRRGKGDWRVFDLTGLKWVSEQVELLPRPADADGWAMTFDTKNADRWSVTRGAVTRQLKFDAEREGQPRCFLFLPKTGTTPTRVAVGHMHGAISLYEITEDAARRVRVWIGHQGEVTSLAAGAAGDLLVSGSSDQTINGWSLKPFDLQRELGAAFTEAGPTLVVADDGIALYSPAWEAGLQSGDEVLAVAIGEEGWIYDPLQLEELKALKHGPQIALDACLKRLRAAEPAKELTMIVRRKGQPKRIPVLTTVRQRPVWRFFADKKAAEWALWMWHRPYYACSTNGDKYLGFQMNQKDNLDKEPEWHQASQLRGLFHKPGVIKQVVDVPNPGRPLAKLGLKPVPINFQKFVPSAVQIENANEFPRRVAGEAVTLRVAGKKSGDTDAVPSRVEVWVNDHRVGELKHRNQQEFTEDVTIDDWRLRSGRNEIKVLSFQKVEGKQDKAFQGEVRAESAAVEVERAARKQPGRLRVLLVGVSNYARSKGDTGKPLKNLNAVENDIKELNRVLSLKREGPYNEVEAPIVLLNEGATPKLIRDKLAELGKMGKVSADDLFLFVLAGHGDVVQGKGKGVEQFRYCCQAYDRQQPEAASIGWDVLHESLARLPCRKCVLLDVCHAAKITMSPLRELTPGGKGATILASCDASESSFEDPTLGGKPGGHGLFTFAVLQALEGKFADADKSGNGVLEADELFDYVESQLPVLLPRVKQRPKSQIPLCHPSHRDLQGLPLVGRPRPAAAPKPKHSPDRERNRS